jgi:hypothetical protein
MHRQEQFRHAAHVVNSIDVRDGAGIVVRRIVGRALTTNRARS